MIYIFTTIKKSLFSEKGKFKGRGWILKILKTNRLKKDSSRKFNRRLFFKKQNIPEH